MAICEDFVRFLYDEEDRMPGCNMDLNEDEMERFLRCANDRRPFYRRGDANQGARR